MNLKNTMIQVAMAVGLVMLPAVGAIAQNAKPFTVPEINQWKGSTGRFTPKAGATRIVTDGKDAEAARIAQMLGQDYTTLTGTNLPVHTGVKAQKGDIKLQIKPDKKAANTEAYTMVVTPEGVTLSAPTAQGLYWGTRTLLQLSELSDDLSIPAGTATDSPEFALRGFLLDCGRKYIPMDYLYKLVDVMSYYKMNFLNIHLNDNGFKRYYDDNWDKTQAAFRMESDTFPGLTARDGSYGKQEFHDFIKYAASKGVEVVPEIDVPAHSLAFTRFKPELASTKGNGQDHLDINKPETHEFLEALLTEYLEGEDPVFCSPKFNIGTDEYQGDSLTMEQFRGFTDRYIRFTEKFGKQPMIWGSLTHAKGQTPVKVDNVLMLGWSNGYANPRDMLKLGYKMVSIPDGYVYIVPNAGYYYDYLNNEFLYDNWTPANIGGQVFTGDTIKQIEGGMFAVWNDHPNNGTTVKDIHHRIMSALPTMAAKTWSADREIVPYQEFAAKSVTLSEAPGINELGRYGVDGEVVLEQAVVEPGSTLPIPEIGYPYTVEFDLEPAAEAKGTVLFESPNATFWLSDPITGRLGYSREDKLHQFRWDVRPGENIHVKVTADKYNTDLWINGKLIDNLNRTWLTNANAGNSKRAEVTTLFFPLEHAGKFNSKLTNLKVKAGKDE